MPIDPTLRVRISADPRELVQQFARSKRALKNLEGDFKRSTAAVAAAARQVRAAPGDAALSREFERLKKAAAGAKREFTAKQTETERLRRALSAQGVSVSNLAADWRRLQAAQRAAATPAVAAAAAVAAPARAAAAAPIDTAGVERIEGAVDRVTQRVTLMGSIVAGVFAAQQFLPYAAALARINDQYLAFNAQLKLAVARGGDLATAQADVARIARAAATGIGETAVLYARLLPSVRALGLAQGEAAKITEVVALSLRVSGASVQEASSAVLQLSQAFGSGVLRGEEFNSVNEAAPRLMQALADAIGRPRGELRGMAEQGLLTAEVLALALPRALAELRTEAEGMPLTVGAAFVNLRNEFMLLVGRINEGVGVFSGFAAAVTAIANNLTAILAGLAAAAAAYVTRRLGGIVAIRTAEVVAERAKLAATAQQAAATAAAQAAELRGIAGLAAASRARAAASAAAGAAAAASTGAVAIGVRTVIGLLTGPVGLAVSIGLAALAWVGFRREGEGALDAVIARQRQLNALQARPPAERAAAADPRSAQLDAAERELAERARQIDRLRQWTQGLAPRARGPAEQRLAQQVAQYQEARAAIDAQRAQITKEIADSARADEQREKALADALKRAEEAARRGARGTGTGRQRRDDRDAELQRERDAAERLARAQRDLVATLADQADRLSAETIAREVERNREAWDARTISAEQYYARLTELQRQQVQIELDALARRRQAAAVDEAGARARGDEPAALAAQGAIARIDTDIELARRRLAELQREAAVGLAAAQTAAVRDQAQALAGQIDAQFAALQRREEQLRNQVELGLPQRAAEEQVNAARREALAVTGALVAQLEELVALQPELFGPDMLDRIERFRAGLGQIGVVADSMAVRINDALGQSLERLFADIAQGTATLGDALRGFLRSIVAEINQQLSRELAQGIMQAFRGAGGAGGGAGGLGGWISGLLRSWFGGGGFARGGYTGPGHRLQPAGVVHAGEYVFPADAVRRLGVQSLAALHRFASGAMVPTRPRLGYADGGAVHLPAGIGAAAAPQSIRIVNTIDPELARDYLESAAGERVIVNAITRNAGAVRMVLQG